MLARFRPEVRRKQSRPEAIAVSLAFRGRGFAGEIGGGDSGRGLVLQFHLGVQGDHLRRGDFALQRLQLRPGARQALGQVAAVQQHGVIGGKVMLVVVQNAQFVFGDFGVGRVNVGDIDLPAGDGFIGQAVIQALRRLKRQAVSRFDARPAVGAFEKLLRQSQFQFGMLRQIGQRLDP